MFEDQKVQVGLCCCVGAALSYLVGRCCSIEAESLRSVIRINQLKDLSLLFDTASVVLPLIVSISGKVGSDRPIKFKSSKLQPVILSEMTTSCILKRKVKTKVDSEGNSKEVCSWEEEHADFQYVKEEVPWYLDDGTSKVFVLQAQNASEFLVSAVTHARDYKSKILPDNQREPDLVVKTTVTKQPVLVTGTPLKVIGQAVKDGKGRIQIQKPKKGPFYVSGKNIDEHINDCEGEAWWFKCTSLVLASVGIFLIGKHTFHYIKGRYCKQEPRNRVLDAVTDTVLDAVPDTPGPDDKESKAEAADGLAVTELIPDLCAVCLEQEYNSVFTPCGHMCCCLNCSSLLIVCPLCCHRIDQVVRVFRG